MVLSKSDLQEGRVYFLCTILDPNIPVPSIEPCVFIGSARESGASKDKPVLRFEHPASYWAFEIDSGPEGGTFSRFITLEEELVEIMLCDVEGAVGFLLEMGRDRNADAAMAIASA